MGNYGIKISKPTKDITSTEPRDYVFNSKYGSVKIWSEPPNKTYETVNVSANSSVVLSIEHGLPFIPMVMMFVELKPGSGHWSLCGNSVERDPTDASDAVSIDHGILSTYVDATYIKMKFNNATASSKTVKYYYFIFADNG